MAQNSGNKKKSSLYYVVAALFLILSGALGGNQFDETVQDNQVSDVTVESQVSDNEHADIQDENTGETETVHESTDETEIPSEEVALEDVEIVYTFRYRDNLESHYEKHGIEMGFDSPEEYLAAANKALADPDILHKIEAEDGDDVYYLEKTNEFIVVSTDGYIRTYYYPTDGIDYFNRQ